LADFHALNKLRNESSIFAFQHYGTVPEQYDVFFRGVGLWQLSDGQVVPRDSHHVRIELGSAYPRMIPSLSWRTPIFHPNISQGGVVCLGGYSSYWVPSLKLDELCIMLWDMIRYKNFDIQSPYHRDAALWARDQDTFNFPLDRRELRNLVSVTHAAHNGSAHNGAPHEPPIVFHSSVQNRPSPVKTETHSAEILFIE
jgi:hypothetical protein